jgi:hypothetical protein
MHIVTDVTSCHARTDSTVQLLSVVTECKGQVPSSLICTALRILDPPLLDSTFPRSLNIFRVNRLTISTSIVLFTIHYCFSRTKLNFVPYYTILYYTSLRCVSPCLLIILLIITCTTCLEFLICFTLLILNTHTHTHTIESTTPS